MSDGMSDGAAVGRLANEAREAAYEMRDALKRALTGHRGMVPYGIIGELNEILAEAGYELRKRDNFY